MPIVRCAFQPTYVMANIPSLTDAERQRVLEAQLAHALAGSEALLIHLGKAYLNQHDKAHLTVEAIPYTQHTLEELQDLLEQRSRAVEDQRLLGQLHESIEAAHENTNDADPS
jgi:hypothetical protein